MVGSLQPIVATSGDDVVLPCHLEPSQNAEEALVEWSRHDANRVQYVHVYRDHGEVTDMKTASYLRRTALFTEELKHGNISLKIMDVTPADEGNYRCFIPTLRSPVKDSTVRLIVRECVLLVGQPAGPQRWRQLCPQEAFLQQRSCCGSCLWRSSLLVIVSTLFLLEPNPRSVAVFPRVPPTVDSESKPIDEGATAGGRAHLIVVFPFVLVPVILVAAAAFFWKFVLQKK